MMRWIVAILGSLMVAEGLRLVLLRPEGLHFGWCGTCDEAIAQAMVPSLHRWGLWILVAGTITLIAAVAWMVSSNSHDDAD